MLSADEIEKAVSRSRLKDTHKANKHLKELRKEFPTQFQRIHWAESSNALIIDGVVPTSYKGSQYNTPLQLEIPIGYPKECPTARVIAIPGLELTQQPYMFPDGKLNLAQFFSSSKYNIKDIVVHFKKNCFEKAPPLRAATTAPHNGAPPHSAAASPQQPPSNGIGLEVAVREVEVLAPYMARLAVNEMEGVVSIAYRGDTFHIPVAITFPPNFPALPPCVRVVEKNGLKLRPGCSQVDSNGIFSGVFSAAWGEDGVTVTTMMHEMIEVFSKQPPLYSPTAGGSASPQTPMQSQSPWACTVCTFENTSFSQSCEMCQSPQQSTGRSTSIVRRADITLTPVRASPASDAPPPVPLQSTPPQSSPLSQRPPAAGSPARPPPATSPAQELVPIPADDMLCTICMERDRTHAYVPCGHKVLCAVCAAKTEVKGRCIMCNADAISIIQIFAC